MDSNTYTNILSSIYHYHNNIYLQYNITYAIVAQSLLVVPPTLSSHTVYVPAFLGFCLSYPVPSGVATGTGFQSSLGCRVGHGVILTRGHTWPLTSLTNTSPAAPCALPSCPPFVPPGVFWSVFNRHTRTTMGNSTSSNLTSKKQRLRQIRNARRSPPSGVAGASPTRVVRQRRRDTEQRKTATHRGSRNPETIRFKNIKRNQHRAHRRRLYRALKQSQGDGARTVASSLLFETVQETARCHQQPIKNPIKTNIGFRGRARPLKFATLNARGLNAPAKRQNIERWLKVKKIDVAVITETWVNYTGSNPEQDSPGIFHQTSAQ